MIITQTLETQLPKHRIFTSPKNFNGELGLSLSVFQINEWTPNARTFVSTLAKILWKYLFVKCPYDTIVLEYGIDRPKEMEFLLSIAKPDIGVFTAIDAVHSEQFGNPQEIAREEVKMVKHTKSTVFLNSDDPYAMEVKDMLNVDTFLYQTAEHHKEPKELEDISFSNADFTLTKNKLPQLEATIAIRNTKLNIKTNLLSKENLGYIGVALTIAEIIQHKISPKKEHLLEKLSEQKTIPLHYNLQPGRLSVFKGIEDTLIFDSTYNASPLSMRSIITTARNIKMKLFAKHPLWLVLWDMRELGDLTEQEHRRLAAYVSQVADHVFLVGEQMTSHMADELEKIGFPMTHVCKFHNAHAATEILKRLIADEKHPCDDHAHHHHPKQPPLLVFKGSQNTIFLEEAVKQFLLNPEDQQYLTRQSARWLNKKKA